MSSRHITVVLYEPQTSDISGPYPGTKHQHKTKDFHSSFHGLQSRLNHLKTRNRRSTAEREMSIVGNHGCLAAFFVLLMANVSTCFGFHQSIPISARIIGSTKHFEPRSDRVSPHHENLVARTSRDRRSGSSKIHEMRHRKFAPVSLSKGFFENLESQSGKDYEWIAARSPLSRLMM